MARKPRSEIGAQAEADLRFWGYHIGKHYAADGYPEESPLLNLLCGHSDINPLSPRFGVNIKDVPGDAWAINAKVMRIPPRLRCALIGRYCLPMNYDTGQPVDAELIADTLGLSVRTYFRKLGQARDLYAGMMVGIRGIRGIA